MVLPSVDCDCRPLVIADDNSFNLMVLEGLMLNLGVKVFKAFNGKEVCLLAEKLSKCKCRKLKGVFTDLEMPIMNGFEESIELKKKMEIGLCKRIPIVAVSAYSDEATRQKCIDCGMNSIMIKPVYLKDLRQKLEELGIIEKSNKL